ncbi:hypothetical protein RHMOL_Rhmol06G0295800 [Rhododendron molle]|uniref:Uncharacterized protein n=1 Tax=Rhododendron molle TaxID=49168 RepID=A0ACC0NJ68_RHOML|nr:hypothetical protein RHMOL_Rhmol06G0295800 [Rhododendron molle]
MTIFRYDKVSNFVTTFQKVVRVHIKFYPRMIFLQLQKLPLEIAEKESFIPQQEGFYKRILQQERFYKNRGWCSVNEAIDIAELMVEMKMHKKGRRYPMNCTSHLVDELSSLDNVLEECKTLMVLVLLNFLKWVFIEWEFPKHIFNCKQFNSAFFIGYPFAVLSQLDVACGEHGAVKGMSSGKGYFLVFLYEKHFENERSAHCQGKRQKRVLFQGIHSSVQESLQEIRRLLRQLKEVQSRFPKGFPGGLAVQILGKGQSLDAHSLKMASFRLRCLYWLCVFSFYSRSNGSLEALQ